MNANFKLKLILIALMLTLSPLVEARKDSTLIPIENITPNKVTTPKPCSGTNVSWGAANMCFGWLGDSISGASSTANPEIGFTGGYTATCNSGAWTPTSATCQAIQQVQEETQSIVGCYSPNNWCANLNGAPANTVMYQTHGANAWDSVIGPRSFCSLGFFAIDPVKFDGNEHIGDFCRVLPVGVDSATGKPMWHIRAGSTGFSSVACHATCIY